MLSYWPGFQGIARYGLWSQLGLAFLFAIMLDAFLLANFYWTGVLTVAQRNIILGLLFVIWITLLSLAKYRRKIFEATFTVDEKDESYRLALQHYLRGNWFETESLILPHLKKKPRDMEMLLLQATLYRHTKRYDEATAVLDRIASLDGANHWFLETELERRYIGEAKTEQAESEAQKLAEVEALAEAGSD